MWFEKGSDQLFVILNTLYIHICPSQLADPNPFWGTHCSHFQSKKSKSDIVFSLCEYKHDTAFYYREDYWIFGIIHCTCWLFDGNPKALRTTISSTDIGTTLQCSFLKTKKSRRIKTTVCWIEGGGSSFHKRKKKDKK